MDFFYNKYDDIARDWFNKRNKPWNFFLEFLLELEHKYETENPINGICCDLGCGTGRHTELLSIKSDLYIGTDLSHDMLIIAKENQINKEICFIQQWICCDIEHLPFRQKSITCIISIAVIHHILTEEKRKIVLKDISSILKKPGNLIISVWSAETGKNAQKVKEINDKIIKSGINYVEHIFKDYNNDILLLKLRKNDIFLPWRISKKNGEIIEIPRIYHLFSNEELKIFEVDFKLKLKSIIGNEKSGENFFLYLKKP